MVKYNKYFGRILRIDEDINVANNKKRRFLLEISLKNRKEGKSISIIMMNPSEADRNKSDKTINKVMKYVYEKYSDVYRIVFLNLYVIYEKKSKLVENLINTYGEDYIIGLDRKDKLTNDEIIRKEIEKTDYIIIAWGKGEIKKYRKRETQILSVLKDIKKDILCFGTLTQEEGYPRHPLYCSDDIKLDKYNNALKVWIKEKIKGREFFYKN